jgi:uncharacterized protein VirK/YbjX
MEPELFKASKIRKRIVQMAYLCSHPVEHWHCARLVASHGKRINLAASLKYLGAYLALSMPTATRRQALMDHYQDLPNFLQGIGDSNADKIILWEKRTGGNRPPLQIFLEESSFAPLEGEMQLRFSFGFDLFFLTFLFASGQTFGGLPGRLLFIGGAQGAFARRAEMREAAKLNGEIAPARMLLIAIRALGKILSLDGVIAIAEDEQVARCYSPEHIKLDYRGFWTGTGGARAGPFYHLPLEVEERPLLEIPITHRARTRRKRAAKREIQAEIEARIEELLNADLPKRYRVA